MPETRPPLYHVARSSCMDPRANLFPYVLIRDARQLALLLAIDPIVYKTRHETQEGGRRGGLRVEGV